MLKFGKSNFLTINHFNIHYLPYNICEKLSYNNLKKGSFGKCPSGICLWLLSFWQMSFWVSLLFWRVNVDVFLKGAIAWNWFYSSVKSNFCGNVRKRGEGKFKLPQSRSRRKKAYFPVHCELIAVHFLIWKCTEFAKCQVL